MNQNQHDIQESWLKQFQSTKGKNKGKVDVVSMSTLASELLSPKGIANGLNFQSTANETQDNVLESPGIKVLHRLKKGLNLLAGNEIEAVQKWMALHLTRSPRSRDDLGNPQVAYDRARRSFFENDLAYVRSFGIVWVCVIDRQDEPLIMSDNPILLMSDKAILCPFSPWTLIGLSKAPQYVMIEGRTWNEVANEMSFSNATNKLYGNPDLNSPWKIIRERAVRYRLVEERMIPVRVK